MGTMGFVRVSGYNEDDMAQARAAATAAENTRMKNNANHTFTYDAGQARSYYGDQSLLVDNEPYYNKVNATNAWDAGYGSLSVPRTGYYDGYYAGYNGGYNAAYNNFEQQLENPSIIYQDQPTYCRNIIIGSSASSVTPSDTGWPEEKDTDGRSNYRKISTSGITAGKRYLFIISLASFTSSNNGAVADVYNCSLISQRDFYTGTQVIGSRVTYLVVVANSNTIGLRGVRNIPSGNTGGMTLLGYQISS